MNRRKFLFESAPVQSKKQENVCIGNFCTSIKRADGAIQLRRCPEYGEAAIDFDLETLGDRFTRHLML